MSVAQAMLELAIAEPEVAIRIHKELQGQAPSPEVVAQVEAMIGRRCTIRHTTHRGVVVSVNRRAGGFYPGSLFPVNVQVDPFQCGNPLEDHPSQVFEYGLDQVILEDV